MPTPRKTPRTWIDAGLAALKKSGPEGLRAETLARDLNTTKGSFYWHFRDVPAFHDAVLEHWEERTRSRFEAAAKRGDTEVTRLRGLAGYSESTLDRAVRAWAVHDKRARKAVAQVDKVMLATIGDLLKDMGATHPDFPGIIHATLIAAPSSGTHAETLIDLLLVLK